MRGKTTGIIESQKSNGASQRRMLELNSEDFILLLKSDMTLFLSGDSIEALADRQSLSEMRYRHYSY